jgi:PAS domain S-box-containing protein
VSDSERELAAERRRRRAAEARYRTLIDSAEDAIYEHELDGRLTAVNRAVERLTGRRRRDLLRMNVQDLVAPEHRAHSRDMLLRRLGGEVGTTYEVDLLSRSGARVPVEVSNWIVHQRGRVVAVHGIARDLRARRRAEARRGALLRVARRFAAEAEPAAIFASLLDEAIQGTGADGAGVYAWDAEQGQLMSVRSTLPSIGEGTPVSPDIGVIGQAIRQRAPATVDDYQSTDGMVPAIVEAGARAGAGVPLLHEGRLVGALGVWSTVAGRRFGPEDLELLELLASSAAATIVGVERARLAGVVLAARTAQHEVNNRLAIAVGYAEYVSRDERLPQDARDRAMIAAENAQAAADVLAELRLLTRLREASWGPNVAPTIDLRD